MPYFHKELSIPSARSAVSAVPEDACRATLVGRLWVPTKNGGGPRPVAVRGDELIDLAPLCRTLSELLEMENAVQVVKGAPHRVLARLDEALDGNNASSSPRILAPADLQPIKAAGVTFAASLIERVIEERAGGNFESAQAVRSQMSAIVGNDLSSIRPGSLEAVELKKFLIAEGMWSQYLEVGIGPDAEIFTKGAPMSAVGTTSEIGLHPGSTWNNPEPEVVLAINSRANVVGATLGNDVNLRDFEGRSALLLGKAKDNNGSCAIGPFLRLFDEDFSIDDVRTAEIELEVTGTDGFSLSGTSSMRLISRDPLELVAQTFGVSHQYPDGAMLFCGTMYVPTQDRGQIGSGFTHKIGDVVTIRSERLGTLVNRVNYCDRIPPWTFGIASLMQYLTSQRL